MDLVPPPASAAPNLAVSVTADDAVLIGEATSVSVSVTRATSTPGYSIGETIGCQLVLTDDSSSVTARVQQTTSTLAITGSNLAKALSVAGALLTLGFLLLTVGRHRRRSTVGVDPSRR